jgi:hypothetical protein
VIGFTYSLLEGDGSWPDGCGVGAFAVLRVPQDEFPALRKRPGPDVGKSLSLGLLRQSDEQSVAAVAAVFHAINDFNLQDLSFADWSVVGAPCLLGRTASAAVLDKYRRLGPRGVSPLVSPYLSLHAVSAMISVALQAHGPNLGVGGGAGAVAEGLLAALTLLLEPSTPGVWLVLTGWDPEPGAADPGAEPAVCHAVALALMPVADDWTGLRLSYVASAPGPGASSPNVTSLARFLDRCSTPDRSGRWFCSIKGGGEMELTGGAGSRVSQLQRAGESL